MAPIIRNEKTLEELRKIAGLITAEGIPQEFENKVRAVVVSNPIPQIKRKAGTLSDGTSATLFTCSTTKKTFLIGTYMSVTKSVANDGVNSKFVITTADGITQEVMAMWYEPLTALSNQTTNLQFSYPMELKKGSDVSLTNHMGTASIDFFGCVYYYELDDEL